MQCDTLNSLLNSLLLQPYNFSSFSMWILLFILFVVFWGVIFFFFAYLFIVKVFVFYLMDQHRVMNNCVVEVKGFPFFQYVSNNYLDPTLVFSPLYSDDQTKNQLQSKACITQVFRYLVCNLIIA